MLSLHQVVAKTGLSRRMIQHYESCGLITPSKNKYQYNEYSQEDVEKLLLIHRYRSCGYTPAQIVKLMKDPDFDHQKAAGSLLEMLQKQKEDMLINILSLSTLQKTGIDPILYIYRICGGSRLTYEECRTLYKIISIDLSDVAETFEKVIATNTLTKAINADADGFFHQLFDAIEEPMDRIFDCFDEGLSYQAPEVQQHAKQLIDSMDDRFFPNSTYKMAWISLLVSLFFLKEPKDAEETFGPDFHPYIVHMMEYLFEHWDKTAEDYRLFRAVGYLGFQIRKMVLAGCDPLSEEAQQNIRQFFRLGIAEFRLFCAELDFSQETWCGYLKRLFDIPQWCAFIDEHVPGLSVFLKKGFEPMYQELLADKGKQK